jgi:holo-[acyl-carrier protein] synthase
LTTFEKLSNLTHETDLTTFEKLSNLTHTAGAQSGLLRLVTKMIIGIGIDIADQIRIREGINKYGERFVQRLFTAQEITQCTRYRFPYEHYAGKFAVKEAFMKAIGTGLTQQVTFRDIEVLNRDSGAPYVVTYGRAAEIVEQLGVTQIHVSLSHAANIAAAVVVLEKLD